MVHALLGLTIAALLAGSPAAASERGQCRLALLLALDVSGSVDPREYRLQLDGTIAALRDPQVRDALFALPGAHVEIASFQWGASNQQRMLLDWTAIRSDADLTRATAQLGRNAAPFSNPQTAIGAAMRFGLARLDERPSCWSHVMDISGDGPSNHGPFPETVAIETEGRVTINALVIGPETRDNITKNLANAGTLIDYYRKRVLRGPGAFVVTARDYDDYRRAMVAKLTRELQPMAVASDVPTTGTPVQPQ